jgi:YVTN family beta-propeller protein
LATSRSFPNAGQAVAQTETSGSKPEITTIEVGFGPQGIAFTAGAVWVAYGNDKDFGVARVDAASNRVVTRIRTGKWPVGMAAGEGAVWVANRDENTVTRVDPESNQVVANVPVGKKPLVIDAGEGAVWVTNSGERTVSRIDPRTNTVVATVEVGKGPSGIAIGDGAVWVITFGGRFSSSGSLIRIDPKTNGIVSTIKMPYSGNIVFAQGSDLWATVQSGALIRIDTATNAIAAKTPITSAGLTGVTVSKGIAWVTANDHATVWRVNTRDNSVLDKIEVGNGPAIIGRGVDPDGAVWVSNVYDGTVSKIRP